MAAACEWIHVLYAHERFCSLEYEKDLIVTRLGTGFSQNSINIYLVIYPQALLASVTMSGLCGPGSHQAEKSAFSARTSEQLYQAAV